MKEKDEDVSLKKATIKKHYNQAEVQHIIRTFTDHEGTYKAAKYDDKGLYQYKKDNEDCLISTIRKISNILFAK